MEIGTRVRIVGNGTGMGGSANIRHDFPIGAIGKIVEVFDDGSGVGVQDATGYIGWVSTQHVAPYAL